MRPAETPPYVLVVDDDPVSCKLLELSCRSAGWKFDLVNDGRAALNAANEQNYDVIITDFQMPEMDGLDLMKLVRARNPGQAFIVVSAHCSAQDTLNLLREGAVDYIQKPLSIPYLHDSVRRVVAGIRKSQLDDNLYRQIVAETTMYSFTSAEVALAGVKLPIFRRLHRSKKIDLNTRLRLELALQEAVTNSLEHGNLELDSAWKDEFDDEGVDRFSKEKQARIINPIYAERKIELLTEYYQSHFALRIRDQGHGFMDGSTTMDQNGESEPKMFGRGLAIIRGVMSQVQFSNNGSEINMIKYFENIGEKSKE